MKTYKIKSLVYLSGFILAAIYYYNIEQQEASQAAIEATLVENVSEPTEDETEQDRSSELAELEVDRP